MNDDCYQRNVLSLIKLQLSVLKVVGTRNFEALKIGASGRRFNILCRNDESRDLL